MAGLVIAVGQVAQGAAAQLVCDGGELAGVVQPVDLAHPTGQVELARAANRVVVDADDLAALGDGGGLVGVVVAVGDLGLAGHGHGGEPIGVVIAVAHTALGGGLVGEPVQVVGGVGDGAGGRVVDLS
jgi:hypothetical protein